MKKLAVLAFVVAAACGGKSSTSTTPGGGSAAEDTPPPEGMAFKDMNADQRMAYMKLTVVPTMKPIFQQFDAKEFAEFNCKTCHGGGAADGTFEMPSPDLPRLPAPENFGPFAEDPKHKPWIEFMATKVTPEMASLLKMTPYDPTTNTGDFSCHACHMLEGEEKKK